MYPPFGPGSRSHLDFSGIRFERECESITLHRDVHITGYWCLSKYNLCPVYLTKTRRPIYEHGPTSNMPSKISKEITYPGPNYKINDRDMDKLAYLITNFSHYGMFSVSLFFFWSRWCLAACNRKDMLHALLKNATQIFMVVYLAWQVSCGLPRWTSQYC